MSNDFGAAIAAMTSGDSASATETATSETATADTQLPDRSASSGESRNADGSALPSESAKDPHAAQSQNAQPTPTAEPVIDERTTDAVMSRLNADPSWAPFIELRQAISGGELAEVMPFLQSVSTDPVAAWKALGQQLKQAGMLGEQDVPKPFAMPDPDLVNEQGQPIAYSAQALAKVVNDLRVDFNAQLQERIDPFESERQRGESERVRAQRMENARVAVNEARNTWEGFKELEPHIRQLISDDKKQPKHLRKFHIGNEVNLERAYLTARKSNQPTLEAKARQTVVSDLQKKAAASTTQTGQRVNGGVAKPPRDFKDVPAEQLQAVLASFGG